MDHTKISVNRFDPEMTHGSNAFMFVSYMGFSGMFRIHYHDKSTKRSTYRSLYAFDCYFEGVKPKVPGEYPVDASCHKIETMTDLFIWVERHKQWLLEQWEHQDVRPYTLTSKTNQS